jgi:ABC transport system ATP-binding/permease protein
MLQEMLSEYEGTLLIVSHDRDFLDRTVTEVLAFEGDAKVVAHIGGYSDYLNSKKQEAASARPAKAEPSAAAKQVAEGSGDAGKTKPKMTFKLVHELEKLPAQIAALEAEIVQLQEVLADADLYTRDPKQFDSASQKLATAQHALEVAEIRWLELEEMRGGC